MAAWLKQSTAVEIKLGPFVDSGDGFTPEDSLTIEDEHVDLAKNGGDWGDKAETTTCVHESQGWYRCLLDTTDTNTLGILIVKSYVTGALPVWREFMVVPANVYDSLIGGGDVLDVSVTQWIGTAATTPNTAGTPMVEVDRIGGSATAATVLGRLYGSGTGSFSSVADSGTTTTFVDAALTAADTDYWKGAMVVFTSGTIAGQARLITGFNAATDTVTFHPATTQAVGTNSFVIVPHSVMVDVWGVAGTVQTAGDLKASLNTIDDFVDLEIAALVTAVDALPTNAELATALGTADDPVLAQIALVKAQTDLIPSDPADASVVAGLIGGLDTKLDIIDNFLDLEVAAILADTNELQTDWVDGGRLDLIVDAINAKTTNLPSDPADASVIAGRFDTLDTSVADLPTNAELATALGTADDAVLTAIDALPTNAELTTALGTADDAVLTQIALVKAQTDLIPSDPADASVIAGRFDTLDTSVADLPTNAELTTALGTADNAILAILGTPADTDIATDISNISAGSGLDAAGVRDAIGLASANLDTQLGDLPTNAELATSQAAADDATLTQIALVKTETDKIASVKTKTDSLTYTVANVLDANIQRVNDVVVTGTGASGDEWGP